MKMKKTTILFFVALATIAISCKKSIQELEPTAKGSSNSLITNEIIDNPPTDFVVKCYSLREKFNNEATEGTDAFSLDSGVIYLQAALNIQMCDANVFNVEHERLSHKIMLGSVGSFTEQQIKTHFLDIKTIAAGFLNTVTYSDKALKYIMIDLVTDELTSFYYLDITIVAGRKDYNPIWIDGDLGKTDYEYFHPNLNYRYNYNGGACGEQPYFAPLDYQGPRAGRAQDMHGEWRGFDYGGAKELEKAINSSYVASVIRAANGDNRITCPTGKKLVYLVYQTYQEVLPENAINSNNNINSKHNPTDIFSYNDWSSQLHDYFPCITGNEMNYYLGKAIPIINNTLVNMLPGYTFADCRIYSGFKRYDGVVFPVPLSEVLLSSFSVNGINRDEYFNHKYNLISTTPTVVVDPNTQ